MSDVGRVLIADDDEKVLQTTADLLARHGFECSCAPDAATATEMLASDDYDVLISDINMPGNHGLEFVREIPSLAKGLPVILMTGYPSMETAIQSVELPVVAYLVKPPKSRELLARDRSSVESYRTYRAVHTMQERVREWEEDLARIQACVSASAPDASSVSISTFLDLTLRNIVGSLSDLRGLTEVIAQQEGSKAACHLLGCPRPAALLDGLKEAIGVLEKTKSSFKSKELGGLRRKLESLAEEAGR